MKKFTQLFITILAFITLGAWSVPAWGGTWYAKINASADPSNGGYVFVGTSSSCSANNATSSTHSAENSASKSLKTSGDVDLWLCAKAKSGYTFKGWNTDQSNTVLSGSTSVPFKVTVHGSAKVVGIGGESYDYYAIFARMVANTPAAGSTTSFDDTNVGSESGWKQIKIDHAHAGTVSISQKGNDADFFVGATTGATTELSSFESTTETTRTLYVKFVPQNNGVRTCTLTVSSNNGLSSLTYYLSGTGYNGPSITWVDGNGSELVSGETTLSAGDILRATCETGQTISYSDFNASYFETGSDANGNYIKVKENISGTIEGVSVTANLAKDNVNYNAAHSETFTLNITNLTPQEIVWDDDISDLSNENMPYTITLSAYAKNVKTGAATGLPVTYSMPTNASLSLSGNVLTVKALGGPFTITASVAGNEDYAPASARKNATVINMTDPCGTSDSHNGATLDKNSKSLVIYPTVPDKLTFRLSKSSSAFILNNLEVREFNANNTKIATTTYSHYDIKTSGDNYSINCQPTTTKIEFYSDAYMSYSCTVSNIVTTRKTTTTVSTNALEYEVSKGQSLGKDVTITYSNVPVFLTFKSDEDANKIGTSLWSLSVSKFGGCGKKGSQTVKVTFHSNTKGNYSDKLYVRNNVGTLLHTIDLSASVTAQTQFLDEGKWNIQDTYLTTDQTTLTATTRVGHTDFTFTVKEANPAGCVTITDGVMTFNASGTATIKADLPEIGIYEAFSTTHNITINKVTPTLTAPSAGKEIKYLQTLEESTIEEDGVAKVTLRGVENTEIGGSFAWTEPTHVVKDAAGSHNYGVTFTPTDGGMYTTNTCEVPVTILLAPQTIEMKDGAVKIAVDGIDKDAADSKLDLDDLIKTQTQDPVEASRAGVVTYEVISENKENATIGEGNVFSAEVIGDYTIRATKAKTDYYEEATDEFVVTVSKRANTMTIAETEYERFVDDVVSNIRDLQNSDAPVQTSSDFPTIAYYDVAQNKIFIPNSESDYQMFGSQKTVTIKIWQEEMSRFEALDTLTITLTVKKYETTKSGEDITLKVNETVTGNYSFTNTSADYPSDDLNADFYYTIDAPNFDNEDLNEGDQLITYDPAEGQITGHNAGTTKITFFQKETYKYTGATLMCNVTVEKRDNQLNNSWGNNVWQKAMNEGESQNVSFTSTHGDYANYPISIDRIYGEDVATLTGNAAGATITTNTTKGYAIWHVSQAENYEYYSAEADVIVTVGVPAPPTCYLYQDNSEHEFATGIGDAEGHFESPIAINSPVDKIWFNAKRQFGGVNKFVVQYSKDNGKSWSTLLSPSLDRDYKSSAFSATFPTLQGSERITNVRFGAATGATLSKWYKNVQISRRAYLNLLDAEKNKISKLPTMMCTIDETSSATEKFYIDYSTCADEIIIESSNPEHFTVSRTSINVTEKHDNLTSAKEEITVTYHSEELGTHNGVITVRTTYQTRVLSVSGETTKRIPELIWQEGYTNNPLTLPVGLTVNAINPAAICTSGASVKYESSDESVVQITEGGYAFKVIKAGSAILTAKAPENDKWKEVSDTRVINATDKIVQEIVWNQTFPRFMEPDKDVIDLDAKVYLRNLTTNELKYSAERTPYITYSCPTGNGVVSISGNKMTVLGYGEVKVTASVGGNADYAAAASVIMLINVRQPSVGCETPLVLNYTDIIDMFEVNVDFSSYTNLTTQEMISDEIAIDHSYGKPDKLSFSYQGGEYSFGLLKFFGGYVKFEQYVNGNWIEVKDSRVETAKNELKTNSDLQLDENADALRIIREQGGTGHHYIRDIQVTRKQYLHETNGEINLGEIKIGQATPVAIGFDYSDVKGDLTARTINNTTDLAIKDNGIIDLECGSFGHYDLQVTFTPTKSGDWQGTVEVYDPLTGLSITVGLTATVTASEEYIFNVEGDWNESENWTTALVPDSTVNITVAKDMIVNTAANVKSITINEGVTVTVKSGVTLKIGNGTPKNQSNGNLHVEDGGQVIVQDGGTLNINDFIIDAKLGDNTDNPSSSGQVKGNNINISGDAYFKISFDPRGAIDYGWYDFTVPFEVDVLNGVFDKDGNKLTNNVDYAVMEFSEAKRAENAKAWTWFRGTLQPGKLYSITLEETKTWNTFIFKRKSKNSNFGSTTFATSYTDNGETTDRGWNGLGNGTLQYCQLNKLPENTKIQVYDHANDRYVEREAAEYTYSVGTAFFVQVDEETEQIDLTSVIETRGFLAPARNGRSYDEFRLSMMDEEATMVADQLWVSASEEATGEYVIGHDLVKMGTPTSAKVAQMWTKNNGLMLCDIEMPLVNNTAKCELGLYAPQAGSYWLAIDKAPEDATLYLTHNDKVIWDLTISPYLFDLDKGTTEGYGLRMAVKKNPAIMTGFDEAETEGQTMRKVLIDDKVYIITPEGKMYDIIGKGIKF